MKKFYIIILLLALNSVSLWGIFENQEIPTGIRALGMGETFTGIADDSTAIRWNPAGLAQIKHYEVHGMLSPMFGQFAPFSGSGLYNSYISFSMPFLKVNTIAVDWLYLGFQEEDDFIVDGVPELGYGEHMVYAAYARKLPYNLYAGAALKYYNMSVDLDNENWARGQGAGVDIGMLWRVNQPISIGLTIKNVLPLKVYYQSGQPNTLLDPVISAGVGYRPPVKNLILGLDINDAVHFGAEYMLYNMFMFRAGFMKGLMYDGKDPLNFTSGFGLRYKFAQLDYALSMNPDFPLTHKFGATFAWGYRAYLVDVISVNTPEMFASLYKSYADEDVVKVVVKNKTKKPLTASVGIYISGLMDSPTEKKVNLAPGTPTEVKLPIVFSEEVMEVTDDVTRNADIIVSYEYDDRKSEDVTSEKFVLYNRNAFVWDDLNKLAGFVTPQDPRIKAFSRGILQSMTAGKLRNRFISDNFYKAMMIYDALGIYGMIYISDPNRPFSLTSEAENAIDSVQYPVESLYEKSGDCDDCVVLYASCLENVGVATILIDVPEHIFMFFDSGLDPEEATEKLGSDDVYIEIGNRVWIPVEATMFGQGFMPAWKEASESLKKWSAKQAASDKVLMRLAYIQKSWRDFPSASIPHKDFGIKLSFSKLAKMIKIDADKILEILEPKFSNLVNEYNKNPKNSKLTHQVGIYYAKNGLYNLAEQYFKKSISLDKNNAAAYNNYGNLYLMLGEQDKAIKMYRMGLKIEPKNQKLLKNLKRATLEKSKAL